MEPDVDTLCELVINNWRSVIAPTIFEFGVKVKASASGTVVILKAVGPELSSWVPSSL
jgi:hypothetical protein